jgi:hypothetical protein
MWLDKRGWGGSLLEDKWLIICLEKNLFSHPYVKYVSNRFLNGDPPSSHKVHSLMEAITKIQGKKI